MRGYQGRCILAFILLLTAKDYCSAGRTKDFMRMSYDIFMKDKGGFDRNGVVNAAIGTYSRSLSVHKGLQELRQEPESEISQGLELTIANLAVLDVGGGVIMPLVNTITDYYFVKRQQSATAAALKFPKGGHEFVNNYIIAPDDANVIKAMTKGWRARKTAAKVAMAEDMEKMAATVPGLGRKMRKLKTMFGVKKAFRALGPVFDAITIGFSIKALADASITCAATPSLCDYGVLISSTLCIIAGAVGIVSLAFPIIAPVAAVLGIVATIIELTFTTPAKPPPALQDVKFDLNAGRMKHMDTFSRMQLEHVSASLTKSGVGNTALYVVNQGHLPNWMEENLSRPEPTLTGPLTLGFHEAEFYTTPRTPSTPSVSRDICTKEVTVAGQCTKLLYRDFSSRASSTSSGKACIYLQEGNGDLVVSSRVANMGNNLYLGPDFYGVKVTSEVNGKNGKKVNEEHEGTIGSQSEPNQDTGNAEFTQRWIIVPTDMVASKNLVGEEGEGATTTKVKLRGLNIDTERNLRLNGLLSGSNSKEYNDIIAIDDMPNLGYKTREGNHKVLVNTGNSGRDALIISGWVPRLEAQLGDKQNLLSLRSISRKAQIRRHSDPSDEVKNLEIKGIKFNPRTAELSMFAHSAGPQNTIERPVGHVRGVSLLDASPFKDVIHLYATLKDAKGEPNHFTVFKFKGSAEYIFDADNFHSQAFSDEEVKFRIMDNSKLNQVNEAGATDPERECDTSHPPTLKIINMPIDTIRQHILHIQSNVEIYTGTNSNRKKIATINFQTHCRSKVIVKKKGGQTATGFQPSMYTNLLDTTDCAGTRYEFDFTADVTGSKNADDVVYLRCPNGNQQRTGGITNVDTIILTPAFFDDCGLYVPDDAGNDYADFTVTFSGGFSGTQTWEFIQDLPSNDYARIGGKRSIKGVKKIVNQFGDEVISANDINTPGGVKLYHAFLKSVGKSIKKQSETETALNPGQRVIMKNINMCILAKTNGGVPAADADYDADDIREDCDLTA